MLKIKRQLPLFFSTYFLLLLFATVFMQVKVAQAAALMPMVTFDAADYDLTTDFTPGDGDVFATTSDGGLGDSGAVDVNGDNLYTTINSFSIPDTGDTISMSNFFQYQSGGGSEYYIGFIASSSVNLAGYQSISEPGIWARLRGDEAGIFEDSSQLVYYYPNLIENQWYKVVFALVPLGSDSYDAHLQLWTVAPTTGETVALQFWETREISDYPNLALNENAPGQIHAFFGHYANTPSLIDNFEVRDDELMLPWEAGDGATAETAFEITSCEELQAVGSREEDLDAYFRLEADVDCANTTWWNEGQGFLPLGGSKWGAFAGEFDGNNKVISNLHINKSDSNVGLFSVLSGSVTKLGLENVVLEGGNYVGGLVGQVSTAAVIEDSYVTSGSVTGFDDVGGFVGHNNGGTIRRSYAGVNVTGSNSRIGGFIGTNSDGLIEESYANGDVEGSSYVGGFVGSNQKTIRNAYARGAVSASGSYVGGFAGENIGQIFYAYSTGDISQIDAFSYIGGFTGHNEAYNENAIYSSFSVGILSVHAESTAVGGFIGADYQAQYNNGWWTGSSEYALGDVYDSIDLDDWIGPAAIAWNQSAATDFKNINFGLYSSTSDDMPDGYIGEPFVAWDFSEDGVWGINYSDPEDNNDGWPFFRWQGLIHNIDITEEGGSGGSTGTKVGYRNRNGLIGAEQSIEAETLESIINKNRDLFMRALVAGIPLPKYITDLLKLPTENTLNVRDLEYGMEGEDVRALQKILINLGYAIPAGPTGFFVNQTESALIAYQVDNNIAPAAGYFGSITRAFMKAAGVSGLWW